MVPERGPAFRPGDVDEIPADQRLKDCSHFAGVDSEERGNPPRRRITARSVQNDALTTNDRRPSTRSCDTMTPEMPPPLSPMWPLFVFLLAINLNQLRQMKRNPRRNAVLAAYGMGALVLGVVAIWGRLNWTVASLLLALLSLALNGWAKASNQDDVVGKS